MSSTIPYILIFATWVLAVALVAPVAARTDGFWPLPLILLLGCSGPVVAVCIS